jgi:hypothetical protein
MIPEGQGVGQEGNYFHMWILEKKSFKIKDLANFNQTWYKHFLHDGNSSLFK